MSKIKLLLSEEELQMPATDDLLNKCYNWLKVSKESKKGRKTRAANRKNDTLFEEIMAFKLPPIEPNHNHQNAPYIDVVNNYDLKSETESDMDSDCDASSSTSSRPITRSLRSRSRTPTIQKATPITPQNQRLRTRLAASKPASGASSTQRGDVLSAALNQQHPSVSVTKIRQLLRADSAQKKKEEEKERHDRLLVDRRAKEERAEAQRRQILEERATKTKEKREQRLVHAAELRKAREEANKNMKLKEEKLKKATSVQNQQPQQPQQHQQQQQQQQQPYQQTHHHHQQQPPTPQPQPTSKSEHNATVTKNDETFKVPTAGVNNIDIIIQDETDDGQTTNKASVIAGWATSTQLREALIEQFSKPYEEQIRTVAECFPTLKPIKEIGYSEIFGENTAVDRRYLCRTSSAVWTPPNRAIKRTSSSLTPRISNSPE